MCVSCQKEIIGKVKQQMTLDKMFATDTILLIHGKLLKIEKRKNIFSGKMGRRCITEFKENYLQMVLKHIKYVQFYINKRNQTKTTLTYHYHQSKKKVFPHALLAKLQRNRQSHTVYDNRKMVKYLMMAVFSKATRPCLLRLSKPPSRDLPWRHTSVNMKQSRTCARLFIPSLLISTRDLKCL